MRFFQHPLVLLVAAGVLCLALIVVPARGQEASDSSSSGHRSLSGIFNLFTSPLWATMERAKRLISGRMDSTKDLVAEHLDQIQLEAFKLYANIYNKSYLPEEIPRRMALFVERRKEIEQSVRDFIEGRLPFKMRENAFIDWDESELKTLAGVSPPRSLNDLDPEERQALMDQDTRQAQYQTGDQTGVVEPTVTSQLNHSVVASENSIADDGEGENLIVKAETIPPAVDWRTSGCVSAPKDQEKCGACYAIATMSVVETMNCLTKVSSPILAPQQIVDCSNAFKNFGCDGGWPTRVMKYLQREGVAARESCYPFVKKEGTCRLRKIRSVPGCTVNASPSGGTIRYKVLNNERDIMYHVAKTGPVTTVMRATDRFLYYGEGIFDDPKCTRARDDVDHAIVIEGYGRENGVDYWLIKNSWGETWGQKGYGKFRRGKNACSIGHWGWVILP